MHQIVMRNCTVLINKHQHLVNSQVPLHTVPEPQGQKLTPKKKIYKSSQKIYKKGIGILRLFPESPSPNFKNLWQLVKRKTRINKHMLGDLDAN